MIGFKDWLENLVPKTEGDIDFQRDICRELVFAWEDHQEARTALERVMTNIGLEPIGEVGQQVNFDNREHQTNSNFQPGQVCKIVEPGWQLVSPRGILMIARAKVI